MAKPIEILEIEEERLRLDTVFGADWSRAEASVTRHDGTACINVTGDGYPDAATGHVSRFRALDVDTWTAPPRPRPRTGSDSRMSAVRAAGPACRRGPGRGRRRPATRQRVRIVQGARLRQDLTARYGDTGAFTSPQALRTLESDRPARESGYLHAVAALEGWLEGVALRSVAPDQAIATVQEVKRLGRFAAELVVLRGPLDLSTGAELIAGGKSAGQRWLAGSVPTRLAVAA